MTRPVSMLRFLSLLSLLLPLFLSRSLADSHFEGFEAGEDEDVIQQPYSFKLPDLPLSQSHSHYDDPDRDPTPNSDPPKPSTSAGFDFWDEDEFEGIPPPRTPIITESESAPSSEKTDAVDGGETAGETPSKKSRKKDSFLVEIACVSYLIIFAINYFTGKKENENIALSWASKFATKDSIFDKNFSLLGVGEGEDSPLLLKEGLSVFKFYASGRRYCQGVVATMELKSRHDLMARLYNMVVPCKDEINFEVQMNDDAMDHVVFAMAKKKLAKSMHKEVVDLQRFAGVMTPAPTGRKWVAEELGIVTESKEVAGDLITETVLDQVFGEKAFENHGKGFISMHFSDQYCGRQKKVLFFKFALPDVNKMAEMTRLVALIPYYIDLIGRYKLSPQARSKAGTARLKLAQEIYREHQNTRQEELQKKKADKKRQAEEANAKLSAEALRKKEAKERARQVKKAMPKIKMSRGH